MVLLKSYILKDFCGEDYELYPVKMEYLNNGRLAVMLVETEDEWFCDLTVNIDYPQSKDNDKTLAFVDMPNNPWLKEYLRVHQIAEPTGYYGLSGYNVYPEYRFDLSKLNEN